MPSSPAQSSPWPLALLGILLFALASLKRNQPSEPIYPKDTADTKRNRTPREPAVIAQVPPTPAKYDGPERRKDSTPPWKKALEIGAVLIALGILGVNAWQSWETRKSAEAAKSAANTAVANLEGQNRSWIHPDFDPGDTSQKPIAANGMIIEPFHITPVGRGPSIDVHGKLKALLVDSAQTPDFSNYEHCVTQFDYLGILSPAPIPTTTINLSVCRQGPNGSPAELKITNAIMGRYFDGTAYIARYGKITYHDLLPPKKEHWLQFCSIRMIAGKHLPQSTLKACLKFNAVDED